MTKHPSKPSQSVRHQFNRLYLGLAFLVIALLAAVLIICIPDGKKNPAPEVNTYSFVKEGIASFLNSSGAPFCSFDIEIADTPSELASGLMYRDSLALNQGMLFLMPRNEIQSFWMKNTYLPLDIVFIGIDSTVVSISENTVPFSEERIVSTSPAAYVLELNAGAAKRCGIAPGIRFSWSRMN
jgi:uncharacterized membrane protein (UPF0127 family)